MAHHRLGQETESHQDFEKARQIADRFPKAESGRPGEGWHDWLVFQIIRREAEALLKNPPAPSGN
jgi:hypothetical protein